MLKQFDINGMSYWVLGGWFLATSIWLLVDPAAWSMVLAFGLIPLLFLWHQIRSRKVDLTRYKNVEFLALRETPTRYSTHVGGYVEAPFRQLLWRLWQVISLSVGKPGMRLVRSQCDRQAVRQRGLEHFCAVLDKHASEPSVTVITASPLNFAQRGVGRLEARIQAINERPLWRYTLIERRLHVMDSIVGRLFFGWQFPEGSVFWCPRVPGLVAWRVQDGKPSLFEMDAIEMSANAKQRYTSPIAPL